jgi:hypothetical protein
MDACERQQYIGEQRKRIMAEATRATLDPLRDLRPRAAALKIPDPLERWKADAREFERKRRAATRRRHEQERADMTRAQAAVTPDDIDERIEQAVSANYEHNRRVMAQVIAELEHISEKRFRAIEARLNAATSQIEAVGTEIRKLNADKADGNGIVRRQCFTPGPFNLN